MKAKKEREKRQAERAKKNEKERRKKGEARAKKERRRRSQRKITTVRQTGVCKHAHLVLHMTTFACGVKAVVFMDCVFHIRKEEQLILLCNHEEKCKK